MQHAFQLNINQTEKTKKQHMALLRTRVFLLIHYYKSV